MVFLVVVVAGSALIIGRHHAAEPPWLVLLTLLVANVITSVLIDRDVKRRGLSLEAIANGRASASAIGLDQITHDAAHAAKHAATEAAAEALHHPEAVPEPKGEPGLAWRMTSYLFWSVLLVGYAVYQATQWW